MPKANRLEWPRLAAHEIEPLRTAVDIAVRHQGNDARLPRRQAPQGTPHRREQLRATTAILPFEEFQRATTFSVVAGSDFATAAGCRPRTTAG
jgi:hypothetical protein